MKILFFDIDGVLNNGEYSKTLDRPMHIDGYGGLPDIDYKNIQFINYIVEETECYLCISSGWRFFNGLIDHLYSCGLNANILGVTPICGSRGKEIQLFIDSIKKNLGVEIESYAVVDDNDLMDGLHEGRFVKTDFDYGLTENETKLIIDILNGKNNGQVN